MTDRKGKDVTHLPRAVRKPPRLRRGIYLLPNLFTTAALFAGFYAVVVAMEGRFQNAAIAILVAMFLDGLDGRVARIMHAQTDFGKEYDSLSDMVSFGLAPALVVYQWGMIRLGDGSLVWTRIGWLAAFFYAVAAAMRLARFNSRAGRRSKKFFEGLPSPSAAGLVASSLWFGTQYAIDVNLALTAGFVVTVMSGALMVSNFRYYSFKDFNLTGRVRFTHLLMIPIIFMFIAVDPPLVLSLLFLGYALSGPIYELFRLRRRRKTGAARQAPGSPADEQAATGSDDQ